MSTALSTTPTPTASPRGARPSTTTLAVGRSPGGYPPGSDVVVGVDGSRTAISTVRWAAREASARGVPLRIVHAAPYLGEPGSPGGTPPEQSHARRITQVARSTARRSSPGTPVVTEIVHESPTTALLRASGTGQLLVLGSSTTGAADELVLASLVQRVAVRTTRPLVVVPRPRLGPDVPGRPVVAVLGLDDASDDAWDDAVVAFAAAAARRTGHPLALIDTHSDPTRDGAPWSERFPDVEIGSWTAPAARAVDLLGLASPTPLLVLATGRPGVLHRSLDGRRRWLLRRSTSPIALVPMVPPRSRNGHLPSGHRNRPGLAADGTG